MILQKNKIKGAFIFLFLFVGVLIFYSVYQNVLLNIYGKYTIGQYKGSTSGGRQGGSDYYFFYHEGVYYEQGIKIIRNKIRKYYYCKFVPSNPNVIRVLHDIEVPHCITPNNVPKQGWDSIPVGKICNEDKPPIYNGRVELN